MGIYAMFYHTRSIGFEAGLMMIKKAYEAVMNCIPENKYGMGNIIGLDESDFDLLLKNEDAEVINVNGSHNFVLSGTIAAVQNILDKAKAEGALHTRLLPVGCPYHSGFIKDSAISFGGFINSMDVKKPVIPVVSCIDQRLVTSADEVKREIISNLVTPLNWMKTIEKIHTSGVSLFYECGAGESLTKLNRFIAGNHKTIRYSQFEKLIV
jgi:[acyl-carrier-protein] S-malonyltransferase